MENSAVARPGGFRAGFFRAALFLAAAFFPASFIGRRAFAALLTVRFDFAGRFLVFFFLAMGEV